MNYDEILESLEIPNEVYDYDEPNYPNLVKFLFLLFCISFIGMFIFMFAAIHLWLKLQGV